jgi:hypothetical protein
MMAKVLLLRISSANEPLGMISEDPLKAAIREGDAL